MPTIPVGYKQAAIVHGALSRLRGRPIGVASKIAPDGQTVVMGPLGERQLVLSRPLRPGAEVARILQSEIRSGFDFADRCSNRFLSREYGFCPEGPARNASRSEHP